MSVRLEKRERERPFLGSEPLSLSLLVVSLCELTYKAADALLAVLIFMCTEESKVVGRMA